MIVVKVELWPGGNEATAREIHRLGIANVSNLREVSSYLVVAKEDNGNETHRLVEGHPRSEGVEALIARAVDAPLMADQPPSIQDRFARELHEISEVMELPRRPEVSDPSL